jgi:hypothetical protein
MRGNSHVRFGGAGRGNGSPERATPRPGPTLLVCVAGPLPPAGTGLRVPHGDLGGGDLPGRKPAAGAAAGRRWPRPPAPVGQGAGGRPGEVHRQPRWRNSAPSRPPLSCTPRQRASHTTSWPTVHTCPDAAAWRSSASTASQSCSPSLGGRPARGRSASASSPPARTRRSARRTVAWLTASRSAISGMVWPWSRSCTHCSRTRRRDAVVACRSRAPSSARCSGVNRNGVAGLGIARACPTSSPNANAYRTTTSFSDTLYRTSSNGVTTTP